MCMCVCVCEVVCVGVCMCVGVCGSAWLKDAINHCLEFGLHLFQKIL